MKEILSIAVALAFMTGVVGFAAATSTTTTTPPATEKKTEKATAKTTDKAADKTAKKPTTKSASGAVKSAAADSLVVAGKEKRKDKEWTFAVDASTKLKKSGKDVMAADLKAGDQVQVQYTEADGKTTATSVIVKPGATKKAANPCAAKTDKKAANPCAAKTPEKK
ncbi:MAG: hypothetical protein HYR51_14205 [Candidatus Rokubacteria bacterium]|nr:hypothetical protein [Candidatus Rokubacteria bacterium]